jgi:protein-S-isoprenylcysteine O-methyltransferase Ste14
MFRRTAYLIYGVFCYATFLASYLYAIGFLGNFAVPKSIDSPRETSLTAALLIDAGLLALFAVQHSVMARPAFKRRWTRIVPEPLERSTYVLFSSVALGLLFWFWQPIGGTIWHVDASPGREILWGLFTAGWLVVLYASFLINHFDLFGLRQTWLAFRGRPYTQLAFGTPGAYRFVRHPLYVGWFLTFWATPTMTAAHLFFAILTTTYILVAIQLEERDLATFHGEAYDNYRREVPMFIPRRACRARNGEPSAVTEPASDPVA